MEVTKERAIDIMNVAHAAMRANGASKIEAFAASLALANALANEIASNDVAPGDIIAKYLNEARSWGITLTRGH